MSVPPEIQYLLDRAAIEDLHARYFQGVDLGDEQQVRSCYTDDVVGDFHGRPRAVGQDAVIAAMPSFAKQASGEWKISTHFMGNLNFKMLQGDHAETETNGFAFLVHPSSAADDVNMRCLRYLDQLVRVNGAWRIRRRLHTLDWSCLVPATFAVSLRERKSVIPADLRVPAGASAARA
ncbi:MAG: nuclear transport factor 2 family protein [Comamonadaceae bacterium]|nr:MAG: nuclear transport factor 2 family protein [Comamonadaceae bacterium]